ncbi:MAG: NHL repeat-containing protein [Planctomycetes bacterium]|nr:NHL repeat-containing protein [Planctomycetota bacterium]
MNQNQRIRVLAWAVGLVGGCVAPLAHASDLLVSSFFANAVGRYDAATGAPNGSLSGGSLQGPLCTRLGPDGLLYVASEGTNSVLRYNPSTLQYLDTIVPSGRGGLSGPTGLTWDTSGNLLVSSFNSDSVLKYDGRTGAFLSTFVTAASGGLDGPDNGTTIGPDGNLYVPSYWGNRILRYNGQTGAFMGIFISSIGRPRVLEFRAGSLYITTETSNSVRKYNATTGAFQSNFVAPNSGGLTTPVGMAFGDDGFLYVGSTGNGRVLKYNGATGAFVGVALGSAQTPIDAPAFISNIPAPGAALVPLAGVAMIGVSRRRRA